MFILGKWFLDEEKRLIMAVRELSGTQKGNPYTDNKTP